MASSEEQDVDVVGPDAADSEDQANAFARSVLGVIASGEWKSAVFTTYTLSLTYVESHVLPALRRSGCETLTIFADTSGYRDSLMEQRSLGVGRDYSVVPVRSKSGIFHPKLVYLEARESKDRDADAPAEDIFLVGSGNVTYPGHGGNIEVLEVLRPSTCPHAFMQGAEFFEALARSEKVEIPDVSALVATATRMRAVASGKADDGKVQFIHSLAVSGKQQMLDAATRVGGKWHELLVLSPYHHSSARPILELAKALRVSKLVAGVPARPGESSAFPFAVARSHFPALRLVAPAAGTRPRGLHAKWFEARGDTGALLLTGSFNATVTSFASPDNVECGVLRQLPAQTTCWEEAKEPQYEPGDFPKREDARRPCLFAVLGEDDSMEGRLLVTAPAGVWTVGLESSDEVLLREEVDVSDKGQFSVPLKSIDTSRLGTLQVIATKGDIVARGWVQVAQVLRLEARNRRLIDAVFRKTTGNETPQDVQLLLDILAQEASRTIQATATPRSKQAKRADTAKFSEVTGAQFAAMKVSEESAGAGRRSLLDAMNAGARGLDLLDALMAALLPRLGRERDKKIEGNNPPAPADPFSRRSSGSEATEQETEQERKRVQRRGRQVAQVYEVLHLRLSELNALLVREPGSLVALEKAKLRLLMVWLGTVLVHQVGELKEPDGALAFLSSTWLREVCNVRLDWEDREWLARHVCGVSAAWALSLQSKYEVSLAQVPTHRAPDEVAQAVDPVRELRRRVRNFFGPKFSQDDVASMAQAWLDDPRATALVGEQVQTAVASLRNALSRPTERQVLTNAVVAGAASQEAELTTYVSSLASLVRQISDAVQGNSAKISNVDVRTLNQCPTGRCENAYQVAVKGGGWELESGIRWRLNKFGVYRCRCGQFLVAKEGP
ncbi:hypothetical protein D3C87_976800 [compost metagenome]